MEKNNTESKNGFLQFSDNLSELIAPVFKGRLKHGFVIVCVILLVIAVIGFIWRSIIHHYVDGLALGESLSIAFAELITRYVLWLLIGFIVFVCLWLIAAVLKTIGQKNAQKRTELETQAAEPDYPSIEPLSSKEEVPSNEKDDYIAPDVPRGIDTELLRKHLKGSFMENSYSIDKTNFDGVVDMLKLIQLGYRKGAKNGKGYTDKDIMQVASLLYQNKFMGHTGKFNVWCTSLFQAMHLNIPGEIRNIKPEKKIEKLFLFLNK